MTSYWIRHAGTSYTRQQPLKRENRRRKTEKKQREKGERKNGKKKKNKNKTKTNTPQNSTILWRNEKRQPLTYNSKKEHRRGEEKKYVYTRRTVICFYKKLQNISCEYDLLNGWNSTLHAAWYNRHVRWTCLFSVSVITWCLWTKLTIRLLT